MVLTSLDAAAGEHALLPHLPALARHYEVLVASTRDRDEQREAPAVASAAYAAAGAAAGRERRRRAEQALRTSGAEVLDTTPEQLPVEVADHYLRLKAQGRL